MGGAALGAMAGGGGGGGMGFTGGAATATSGDATSSSATGAKTFNFGGNPNVGQMTTALSNPYFIGAAVIAWIVYLKFKKK